MCSAVNLEPCLNFTEISLVTCGGQAAIPLAYAIGQTQTKIQYIEVVSSISSMSAGLATRNNLDEYIETTEKAIGKFSGCNDVKAIINLNPANPCIDMQTTIMAIVEQPDLMKLQEFIDQIVMDIQKYVPGYQLIISPTIENGRMIVMIKVKGYGDYLLRMLEISILLIVLPSQWQRNLQRIDQTKEVTMNHLLISDPTLRDGSHAVQHQLTRDQILFYAEHAELTGIPILEVGHGNGLGASSLQLGKSLVSDTELLEQCRAKLTNTKLGIHVIPGFATINKDLNNALDIGVNVVRVASHCTEANITKRHIEYSRNREKKYSVY